MKLVSQVFGQAFRWGRRHWVVSGLAVLFFLYSAGIALLGPVIIRRAILSKLADAGCPAVLEGVQVNPFRLAVHLANFEAKEPDGAELLSFSFLTLNFQARSIWHQAVLLDEIDLENPALHLRLEEGGRLNLTRIFGGRSGGGAPVRFSVRKFSLLHGAVSFSDKGRPVPFEAALKNVAFDVESFDTEDPAPVEFSFSAESEEGESLRWSGRAGISPFRTDSTIELRDIRLARLWQYFGAPEQQWKLTEGTASASGLLRADAGKSPAEWTAAAQSLTALKLKAVTADGAKPLAEVPELSIERLEVKSSGSVVSLGKALVRDCSASVRRKRDAAGAYYELSARPPKPGAPAQDRAPAAGPAWKFKADQIKAQNCRIVHEDQALTRPAVIEATGVSFAVGNLAVGEPGQFSIDGEAALKTGGRVKVNGQAGLQPVQAALAFAVEDLALPAFESYLADYLQASLAAGVLGASGSFDYDANREVSLKVSGQAQVRSFVSRESDPARDLLSWKQLLINELLYEAPARLRIKEVQLLEPLGFVERKEDGTLNVSSVLREKAPQEQVSAQEKTPAASYALKIDALTVDEGAVKLIDRTVSPPAELELKNLRLEAADISNTEERAVPAKISGRLIPNASVQGTADLSFREKAYFDRFSVELQNFYFPELSPYVAKYAGRKIHEGGLQVKLDYRTKGGHVSGNNVIALSGLEFGEKINSPDAVSLPLELAAALLKDRAGTIRLEFPVQGSLAQPDFRIGALILRAIRNLITDVVSSPFSLLASLAGTKRSLDKCFFPYGSAALEPEEQARLRDLAKALEERPALSLTAAPLYDPDNDKRALAKQELRRALEAQAGGAAMDDSEYGEALLSYYRKRHQEQPEADNRPAAPPQEEVERFSKGGNLERAHTTAQVQEFLLQQAVVAESDLENLARARGENIKRELEKAGSLGRRLSVLDPAGQKFRERELFVPLTLRGGQ